MRGQHAGAREGLSAGPPGEQLVGLITVDLSRDAPCGAATIIAVACTTVEASSMAQPSTL